MTLHPNVAARFEWRYVVGGAVKHALRHSSDLVAVCGIGPFWIRPDWYGTGSQAEYERVEALPACRLCVRRMSR